MAWLASTTTAMLPCGLQTTALHGCCLLQLDKGWPTHDGPARPNDYITAETSAR